jgi:hypothetical protein
LNGDRLKIAVFIDFDNIEIGVKSTLNRHFDVGTVLEAIKERGEVVTKLPMVIGNGPVNTAAAWPSTRFKWCSAISPPAETRMAPTSTLPSTRWKWHSLEITSTLCNCGGDSDFLALVEKLKQYDKKVMVVGGRSFTSIILQKNCHEFIAYENLIAAPQTTHTTSRRPAAERSRASGAGRCKPDQGSSPGTARTEGADRQGKSLPNWAC